MWQRFLACALSVPAVICAVTTRLTRMSKECTSASHVLKCVQVRGCVCPNALCIREESFKFVLLIYEKMQNRGRKLREITEVELYYVRWWKCVCIIQK